MAFKLSEILPRPSQFSDDFSQEITRDPWFKGRIDVIQTSSTAVVTKEPPPYGHRKSYIPRSIEDYGDGGAFPEIHSAQFPLGKKFLLKIFKKSFFLNLMLNVIYFFIF